MKNQIKIPIIFFLIFLISKEIFSHEGEKIVVFCILTFIIIAYFNTKEMISNSFLAKSEQLTNEYNTLVTSKENLEKELKKFWNVFLDIEDHLIEIYCWIKHNLKVFINKSNKNRKLLMFHIVKDQLNVLVKDQIKINQKLNLFILKNSIINLKIAFSNNIIYKLPFNNNIEYFFEKLINISTNSNIIYLILNKLNINKDFYLDTTKNWINLNLFLFLHFNYQYKKVN